MARVNNLNFLEKLFGKRQAMQKSLNQISISNLGPKLKEFKNNSFLQLYAFCKPTISEIRANSSELIAKISEIDKIPINLEEGNPQLRKVVLTSKDNFIKAIKLIHNSIQPKEFSSFEELASYSSNSLQVIEKEISSYGKNIAYTAFFLKKEVKETGQMMQAIHSLLSQLYKAVSSSKIPLADDAILLLHSYTSISNEISSIDTTLAEAQSQLSSSKESLKLLEQKHSEFMNSKSMADLTSIRQKLSGIENSKFAIKTEILNSLAPIEKQLQRFSAMAASGQFPLAKQEQALLNSYLQNPLSALQADKDCANFKGFLNSIKTLIENGQISVKEKEKEKRLQSISYLLDYDFSKISSKLSEVAVAINSANEQISKSTIESELSSCLSSIEETKRSIQEAEKSIANFNSQKEKLLSQQQGYFVQLSTFVAGNLNSELVT